MVYKLSYKDRDTAIKDLLNKGVYVEKIVTKDKYLVPGNGIDAIVDLQELITANNGSNFDILTNKEINFGDNQIFPKTPTHEFL